MARPENISIYLILLWLMLAQIAIGQDEVKIESTKITDQIYMLTGNGGNLGLFIGQDGTFLIDDQFAPLTEKIIPGQGPLTSRDELSNYLAMLETAYERLRKLKADGKTAIEAIEAKPLADLEEEWGGGLFTGDKWSEIIYPGV